MGFKKGQKLKVVNASGHSRIANGEIVEVASDTFGGEFVHIVGKQNNPYFQSRFVPAPSLVFKAGQRVRLTQTGYAAKPGSTAVVQKECKVGDTFVTVKWDRENALRGFQSDGEYLPSSFEAAPEAKPPFTPTFKKGQKLQVVEPGAAFNNGEIVVAASDSVQRCGAEHVAIEGRNYDYEANRFVAAPAFTPKFKKGDKLRVFTANSGLETIGQLAVGDVVTATADSSIGQYSKHERVTVDKNPSFSYLIGHFEPAPVVKPKPEPKLKKGARLLVVDASDSNSLTKGETVVAASDSFPTTRGNEAVRLEGRPSYKQYLVKRFVPAPAFKKGDRVTWKGSFGNLKKGATATVGEVGPVYLVIKWDRNGLDGGQADGSYYPASFDLAPSPAPKKYLETSPSSVQIGFNEPVPGVVYLVQDSSGDSFLTSDLTDIEAGDKVAVFKFSHAGTAKVEIS